MKICAEMLRKMTTDKTLLKTNREKLAELDKLIKKKVIEKTNAYV